MSAQRPNPAAIDALAQRVVEMLEPRLLEALARLEDPHAHDDRDHDPGLLGVTEIARRLGRSPDWVRGHAEELGVLRFGSGTGKPRLYFDPEAVAERMRAMQGAPVPIGTTPAPARRNGGHARTTAPLLEIRGQR